MKVTVLGCGSSLGTPAAGGFWGRCDPAEPRNSRTRASILVEEGETRVLVDATVDLRDHLNRHHVQDLDAVLLTHVHSDHINGLDDLRAIAYHHEKKIDLISDAATLGDLKVRFPYMFGGGNEIYTTFVEPREIARHDRFRVGALEIESFAQDHKTCISLGFRFGNFAYSVDVAELSPESLEALKGVETWIVDGGAYRREAVSTHANLQRVEEWARILKPRMTYVTVLSTHMDYRTLCDELPPHIRPAWDGLEIEMGGNGA